MEADVLSTLREVLTHCDIPWDAWLFLPESIPWVLDSEALIARMDEVPPEGAYSPKAGYPERALAKGLLAALDTSTVQDIVANARQQRPDADEQDLLRAFLYYYGNDAFIDFAAQETRQPEDPRDK
jgi:hypothetical protein